MKKINKLAVIGFGMAMAVCANASEYHFKASLPAGIEINNSNNSNEVAYTNWRVISNTPSTETLEILGIEFGAILFGMPNDIDYTDYPLTIEIAQDGWNGINWYISPTLNGFESSEFGYDGPINFYIPEYNINIYYKPNKMEYGPTNSASSWTIELVE